MVIGGDREEHFVIRPSRIDVIIFSSEVLLATDSYHLNRLDGVARESTIFQNCVTEKSTRKEFKLFLCKPSAIFFKKQP